MPTTLPRVQVSLEPSTFAMLERVSRAEGASLSQVVASLVQTSLELSEDLALAEVGQVRLRSFRRDDALTTDALLTWNRARKAKR
ncbi:MAG: toxin-antitoxin system, antitoxin component [Candidatus Omnitrophica bacterium]|nr:toxin-antitoxin system, antitoxin component [Candidatus Omnitrophota bacterium]